MVWRGEDLAIAVLDNVKRASFTGWDYSALTTRFMEKSSVGP